MEPVSLNLSRKWRSQNFDQIVGQSLAVRILKNSLYMGQFFPVYLLAGQRGCGKTSTARVFAAALNCAQLSSFQKDPKNFSVPCLECQSCNAMKSGNHPDFIEIDAASHTGVDNMREIIESSSLLPIMGSKRVYLIDEAHMLSKAAFNAALKVLEEPAPSALFILATTNPHKILDTVRSRCFQLFFTPIAHNSLKTHLQMICSKENIAYEPAALDIIVRQSQGSARDALNILEQVRFSSSLVNEAAVLKLLGHMNDQHIIEIISVTLQNNASHLLQFLQKLAIEHYSAEFVWQRLMIILRALMWIKYGIKPSQIVSSTDVIESAAPSFSLVDLQKIAMALYSHEELFLKTTNQHALLEMILLNVCQDDKKKTDNDGGVIVLDKNDKAVVSSLHEQAVQHNAVVQPELDIHVQWERFVNKIFTIKDPLIHSLFKQAECINYDNASKKLNVEFPKELVFFKESLETTQNLWQPLLRAEFFYDIILNAQFIKTSKVEKQNKSSSVQEERQDAPVVAKQHIVQPKEKTSQISPQKQFFGGGQQQQYQKKAATVQQNNELKIDTSDESVWQTATMLLRHFPGVITEIRENQ
jgi:DNA polymerase III subunit gamma/tau